MQWLLYGVITLSMGLSIATCGQKGPLILPDSHTAQAGLQVSKGRQQ